MTKKQYTTPLIEVTVVRYDLMKMTGPERAFRILIHTS